MGGSISDPVMRVFSGIAHFTGNGVPRVCIETGTYQAESTAQFARIFNVVHTIELSEKWYASSKEKLSCYDNVTCHHGDSADVLRDLLPTIAEPVVFFLDAHYSGGSTALGREQKPLLRELEPICARSQKDILIVDDLRLIGHAGECGYDDDATYPRMTYDWTNVTLEKIRRLTGKGLHNPWVSWWDKIIILRNQTLPQGIIATMVATPFNLLDVPLRVGKHVAKKFARGA